jgi:hypothetical protein
MKSCKLCFGTLPKGFVEIRGGKKGTGRVLERVEMWAGRTHDDMMQEAKEKAQRLGMQLFKNKGIFRRNNPNKLYQIRLTMA